MIKEEGSKDKDRQGVEENLFIIVLLQLLVYLLLSFLLLLSFYISLLTPDQDYVSKALVFLTVIYVSSYR